MQHPRLYITANGEKDGEYKKHDTTISWTVAFVRFAEPASAYSGGVQNLTKTKKILIVENDCIAVNINNSKNSFEKTCSLQMKVTDNWYQSNVNAGDWVFVWLSDSQEHNNHIQHLLGSNNFSDQKALNGYHSGLKFVGRVLSLGSIDTIMSGGVRTLSQTVNCQAFLELASSIYYSYASTSIYNPSESTPSGDKEAGLRDLAAKTKMAQDALNKDANVLTSFSDKFLSLYSDKTSSYSPDSIIGYLFALTMGVSRQQNPANAFLTNGIDGTFNDAITIPKHVDSILGNRGATRLCQIYQLILGLQKYNSTGNASPAKKLNPDIADDTTGQDVNSKPSKNKKNGIIYQTPDRCKGFVPFYPPSWDNTPIWNIFTPYLNPVVNEMYTALRLNKDGIIMPTLVVREIPLSTGFYNVLKQPKLAPNTIESVAAKKGKKYSQPTKSWVDDGTQKFEAPKESEDRSNIYDQPSTYFGNLPRWVIDESMILSVATSTSESARVNFVQVWGKSAGAEWNGAQQQSIENLKISQMNQGNYRADVGDIQRHGLRAAFFDSQFDVLENGNTQAPEWARRRADWMFNGHLKLSGTITCVGIEEPICEGDNVEVRGIVYHIDAVSHTARLGPTGRKEFTTTLQVSNGLVASSLNKTQPPSYACHLPKTRIGHVASGHTEVQTRESDSSRDDSGESKD